MANIKLTDFQRIQIKNCFIIVFKRAKNSTVLGFKEFQACLAMFQINNVLIGNITGIDLNSTLITRTTKTTSTSKSITSTMTTTSVKISTPKGWLTCLKISIKFNWLLCFPSANINCNNGV